MNCLKTGNMNWGEVNSVYIDYIVFPTSEEMIQAEVRVEDKANCRHLQLWKDFGMLLLIFVLVGYILLRPPEIVNRDSLHLPTPKTALINPKDQIKSMAASSSIQLKLTELVKQELEKDLVMEKKPREVCLELIEAYKNRRKEIDELEKRIGDPFAEGAVRMLKKVQGRDWERITRLHIMVNQSDLSIKEKHLFVVDMELGIVIDSVVV
ncbi:hypothetical protein Tco_0186127 [Tanacetum coccineum]